MSNFTQTDKKSTLPSECPKKLIDINTIKEIPTEYPEEFNKFCITHELKPPKISTGNGKALATMLWHPDYYWDSSACDEFVKKFNIITRDSINYLINIINGVFKLIVEV